MVQTTHQLMAQAKQYMGYSRFIENEQRYETWDESVKRVCDMHREKFAGKITPELEELLQFAQDAYSDKTILGAQRALQFGGEQLFKHEARMYNCASTYANRVAFFQETLYLLLCGAGVGFSVQTHHIATLPPITFRTEGIAQWVVEDSIEGWADALGALISSYMTDDATFPEVQGKQIFFDYSQIRPQGAEISGGFKAPGPDGLRHALEKVQIILDRELAKIEDHDAEIELRPIDVYDIVMHSADAVLSGGVRRSATICLFSKHDDDMLKAKTGDWFITNPQRGRSNNSVVLIRDEVTRGEWANIMKSVRDVGEPGFIFSDSTEHTYNPCVEVGKLPKCKKTGEFGFQFCNLTEINGAKSNTLEEFLDQCKAAAILGTLQAGYTNFSYVSDATKRITEQEALIGVGITGWMNNPEILFDEANQRLGAQEVKKWNKIVADIIGINQAARCTVVKPSGNASVILGSASGIHGEHAPRYLRNVQINITDEVLHVIEDANPKMVEPSVWSATGQDMVMSFPLVSKEGSIYKSDLLGVKQLEYVKNAQQNWIEYGTNEHLSTDPKLRHNVSNTITVDDWDEVEQYIFDNRKYFAGISLLAAAGDRAYPQAPFTEVFTAEQLLEMYGTCSMFAGGLVVDARHAFNNNVWTACDTAQGFGVDLSKPTSENALQRDWVRRLVKFADKYLQGDLERATALIKDCNNLHKWESIMVDFKDIDFSKEMKVKSYTEVDSMGASGCAGGKCEIDF